MPDLITNREFLHANVDYSALKQVRLLLGAENRYKKFVEEHEKIREQLSKTIVECMKNGRLSYDYDETWETYVNNRLEDAKPRKIFYTDLEMMWQINKKAIARGLKDKVTFTTPILKSLSKSFRVSANEVAFGETVPIMLPRRVGTLAFYLSLLVERHQIKMLKIITAILEEQGVMEEPNDLALLRERITEFANSKYKHPYDLGGEEVTGHLLQSLKYLLSYDKDTGKSVCTITPDTNVAAKREHQLRIGKSTLFFCFEFGIPLDYIIYQDYTDCAPLAFKDDNLFARYPDHCFYVAPENEIVKKILSIYLRLNDENKQKAYAEIMSRMVNQPVMCKSRTDPRLVCSMDTIAH